MNEFEVVGVEHVHYVSKKTGRTVDGNRIYFSCPIDPGHGSGIKTDSAFLSSSVVCPCVCDVIRLFYDRYGNVATVEVI